MSGTRTDGLTGFGTLFVPLARSRTLILAFLVLGVGLGLGHFFLAAGKYEAKVVILPDFDSGSSLLGGASDLAMMAGIRLGGGSEPTLYYRDIMLSDYMLNLVLWGPDEAAGQTVGESLGYTSDLRGGEKAVRRLRRMLSISRNSRTGIVTLAVRSPSTDLSGEIANRLVAGLDQFLKESQSERAGSQATFLSGEVGRADSMLDAAERVLADFKVRNRMFSDSPELQREESRLQREVLIREAVLVELRKQAEVLNISAKEKVSKVKVIEPARGFQKPVYPRLFQSLFVGVALMLTCALGVVYSRAYLLPALSQQFADV